MSFIEDGANVLPDVKQQLYPMPAGANPAQYVSHTDMNALRQALLDLRDKLLVAGFSKSNAGTAEFSGSDDHVDITFSGATGDGQFSSGESGYKINLTIEHDSGPVPVVYAPSADKTLAGFRIKATAAFVGRVHWEAKI